MLAFKIVLIGFQLFITQRSKWNLIPQLLLSETLTRGSIYGSSCILSLGTNSITFAAMLRKCSRILSPYSEQSILLCRSKWQTQLHKQYVALTVSCRCHTGCDNISRSNIKSNISIYNQYSRRTDSSGQTAVIALELGTGSLVCPRPPSALCCGQRRVCQEACSWSSGHRGSWGSGY